MRLLRYKPLPATPLLNQASSTAPATGPRDDGSVLRPGIERLTLGAAFPRGFGQHQRHRPLRLVMLGPDMNSDLNDFLLVSNLKFLSQVSLYLVVSHSDVNELLRITVVESPCRGHETGRVCLIHEECIVIIVARNQPD